MASENVAASFSYQTALLIFISPLFDNFSAIIATSENKPNKHGVVRVIALSENCRFVSMPKCRRDSSKVTSTCHRRINHSTICCRAVSCFVQSTACVSTFPSRSRTRSPTESAQFVSRCQQYLTFCAIPINRNCFPNGALIFYNFR